MKRSDLTFAKICVENGQQTCKCRSRSLHLQTWLEIVVGQLWLILDFHRGDDELGQFGGYILETGAGRKMGCEEKGGVKDEDAKVLGLNNWVLIVRKQILREEIQDLFQTFGM